MVELIFFIFLLCKKAMDVLMSNLDLDHISVRAITPYITINLSHVASNPTVDETNLEID